MIAEIKNSIEKLRERESKGNIQEVRYPIKDSRGGDCQRNYKGVSKLKRPSKCYG